MDIEAFCRGTGEGVSAGSLAVRSDYRIATNLTA